jgi:hypothetical protein
MFLSIIKLISNQFQKWYTLSFYESKSALIELYFCYFRLLFCFSISLSSIESFDVICLFSCLSDLGRLTRVHSSIISRSSGDLNTLTNQIFAIGLATMVVKYNKVEFILISINYQFINKVNNVIVVLDTVKFFKCVRVFFPPIF